MYEKTRPVRYVIAAALLLFLSDQARAQGLTVQLGGPLYECRPSWDFAAGTVHVRFSAGYLVGPASQPPRFEATTCGNSRISISMGEWVKNVQMRVSAGAFVAQVFPGGGSVNPGGAGRIVTVPGPTTVVEIASTGGGRVTVGEISFELADPPALFSFGPTNTGRVLTHKYRSDDTYPSPLQTEDGRIRVEGRVHDLTGSTGIGGRRVYFRLIDPPDTANYAIKAGDAQPGDNADGLGSINGSSTATATSDGNGKIYVTLQVSDYAAGDNYQIEASLDKDFKCSPAPCQKSIVYTAWKRIYVEMHKMFKVGAFIKESVTPGDKRIIVDTANGFPPAPFKVRLIHAGTVESPTADYYSETVEVVDVRPVTDGVALILSGENDPAAPGVLSAYAAEETVRTTTRTYLRDAVGVITGTRSADYLLTNGKLSHQPFEDAFVESSGFRTPCRE